MCSIAVAAGGNEPRVGIHPNASEVSLEACCRFVRRCPETVEDVWGEWAEGLSVVLGEETDNPPEDPDDEDTWWWCNSCNMSIEPGERFVVILMAGRIMAGWIIVCADCFSVDGKVHDC